MKLTSRQLALELLSAQGSHRALPAHALSRAAELFDLTPASMRVALLRLCKDGHAVSPERGMYRLGEAARPVHERVTTWRELEELVTPWEGAWIGVHTGALARSDRKAARRRARALRLWGFRCLAPSLFVRPDNLRGSRDVLQPKLAALGLEAHAPVFVISDLGPHDDDARALWADEHLDEAYGRMIDALLECEPKLEGSPPPEVLRTAFVLGREALRWLVLDPLLPEPLVDARERRRLGETMARFEAKAQQRWRHHLSEPRGHAA